MAVVEVSITPLGTASPSVSSYVAGCLRIVISSGIKYQLTPMGTVMEGDIDQILRTIRLMQESVFDSGALRVSTLIKIDDRRDLEEHSMDYKVRSVEGKV